MDIPQRKFRILSIDGGGIKGGNSAYLLSALESQLAAAIGWVVILNLSAPLIQ